MKVFELLKLEFKNFLKSSLLSMILIAFILFFVMKNIQIPFGILKQSKNFLTFLTFSFMIAVSYGGVFLFTFSFNRRKLNNVYHKYFIFPIEPIFLFLIELFFPIFFSFLVGISFGIFIFWRFHPVSLGVFILITIACLIFIIGTIMSIFSLILIMRNIQIIHAIKFLLIFAFSYLPNFSISKGYPVIGLLYGLLALVLVIFFIGIILIKKVNPEKVILS